jgi:transcriptional regulator with XRE-family HTH domain
VIFSNVITKIPNMQHKRNKNEIEYCKCLSKAIKKLRKAKGMSGNCLALDSWIASSTFCRIENNQNTPQITTIAQIAYGLGIPLSELIIELEKNLPKDFTWAE